MTTTADLRPCPCCGSKAALQIVDDGHYIECSNPRCGITTQLRFACGDDPFPLLAETWNRRPPSITQLETELDEARAENEQLRGVVHMSNKSLVDEVMAAKGLRALAGNRAEAAEARIRAVEGLPGKWKKEQSEYPDSSEGQYAAAAVRLCARELQAALREGVQEK